jgi:hypothetical protein
MQDGMFTAVYSPCVMETHRQRSMQLGFNKRELTGASKVVEWTESLSHLF